MHVQAGVEGYDIFTRGLAIGPQTMVTHYDPTKPCTSGTRSTTTS
jgi:hypothetical protein